MSKLFIISLCFFSFISNSNAQYGAVHPAKRPNDWWQADMKNDSLPGISLDEAYKYLKGRKSKTVIVAIIDDCIDTAHEELKDYIWTNKKEIAGNGLDDDNNGYIDDLHGWCFVANNKNEFQTEDLSDEARTYLTWRRKFENIDSGKLSGSVKIQYAVYQTAKKNLFERYHFFQLADFLQSDSAKFIAYIGNLLPVYQNKRLNQVPFSSLNSSNHYDSCANLFFADLIGMVRATVTMGRLYYRLKNNKSFFRMYFEDPVIANRIEYDTTKDFRLMIGDDDNDFTRIYGTQSINIKGHSNVHATFIAGIIAANRQNNLGIKGIADNVLLMPLVVGKEAPVRDKDMVFAIHYAVDNGAFIINISISGPIGEHVKEMMEAFDYANMHGVLIVNGAGNDGLNLDTYTYYFGKGDGCKESDEYIRVGATTTLFNDSLIADLSDIGEHSVDIFGPGISIYSTLPDNKYGAENGTSFACPMVAGVAALVKSYFPSLTAKQVKEIIMKSSFKPDILVMPPLNSRFDYKMPLSKLSKSGGIVNAYNAVKMADEMTGNRN